MKKYALLLGLGALCASPNVLAQDVAETIEARRGLMQQTAFLSSLARALADSGDEDKLFDMYATALSTAQSLEAFALMFPEDTNLLGSAEPVEGVSTTAAAAIWDDLEGFRALVKSSANAARIAADSTDVKTFAAAWTSVEQTCSSCHDSFVFYDPFAGM